jgi:hypothetical protein
VAISPPVEAALGAFRDLAAQALPAEARAQRLRTEVLLPLARAYGDALLGDDTAWRRTPGDLPDHQRATFAAARACLVVLGNGRSALTSELLREVLRLGEGFCDLHLRVLAQQDPLGRDTLSRLGCAQLQATLSMVGAEATGDLGAAHRARQRFAELGDEAAVQACEHLVRRLGGAVAPDDDPLKTVEMQAVPFGLLGGSTAAQPAVSPGDAAPTVEFPTFPAPSIETLAESTEGPAPTAPRHGPTTEALATIAPAPPAGPIGPPLRPIRSTEGSSARRGDPQAPTMLTSVWPPPRNERLHRLTTALVLVGVATAGLVGFGAARRAAASHRASQAEAAASAAPEATRPTAGQRSPGKPAPATPTFAVTLAPPTAAAPLLAAVPPAAGSASPEPSGPEPEPAPPPATDEPPRARARRLNTEGFRAYERGDLALALAQYRAATEADPSLALPWYNLACVEALEGRVDAALEALETFHRIEPGVDLARRVAADRDFAKIRALPAFRTGLAALLDVARPQVPATPP